MSEQDKQTEPWTLEQIKADAKEDNAFWESPEFNAAAWDIVRLYTQKKSLLSLVESQALEIEQLRKEFGDAIGN